MKLDPLDVASYDYYLPSDHIAKFPASPADSAKLLVYDRKSQQVSHITIKELPEILPSCAIVFNDTKVIKARVFGKKASGGKVELLLNRPLANKQFDVFIRGRVKEETKLLFDRGLEARVVGLNEDGSRVVEFFYQGKQLDFATLLPILETIGTTPLPPYINREAKPEDEQHYQPIFAKNPGAVAAPTASLHFTASLLQELQKSHPFYNITLHVGAGTFKPVEAKHIEEHKMHSEYYTIPPQTCKLLDSNKPLLAIGTTVTRAIEYYIRSKKCFGECDLFLHPLNPPKRVNYLLTNFHLPKSTLIMLVASFIGVEKTLELYKLAIAKDYRFYSYGDAMLIL